MAVTAGDALPHGTTIVALKYAGGVLIAGDRRSTQGNMIAGRDVQKVYITDDYTATGIAGTAALAVEFARLYAVELEHYEKLEGLPMTFAGKVNRLAIMVRGNLGAALQGFVALPLLVGYVLVDSDRYAAGRIVSFDAADGWQRDNRDWRAAGAHGRAGKRPLRPLDAARTERHPAVLERLLRHSLGHLCHPVRRRIGGPAERLLRSGRRSGDDHERAAGCDGRRLVRQHVGAPPAGRNLCCPRGRLQSGRALVRVGTHHARPRRHAS